MITAPNLEKLDWLVHGFGLRDSAPLSGITTAKQIHSDIVLDAAGRRGEVIGEGDGLISCEPGVIVGVKTADCVPILLADNSKRIVASIHAGWRGTAKEIVTAAVRHMSERWQTRSGGFDRGHWAIDRGVLL